MAGASASGERVALALGAGGARGLAQIGVIEALLARGLQIDAIAGSSCGAVVGGVYAAGKLEAFSEGMQKLTRNEFLRMLDPALGTGGLFRGDHLVDAMRAVVGDTLIEELPIPFVAVAVDLQRQREVWLRNGPLWQALRASFAIPGLFTPVQVHGRPLVDGGLLAPLPIAATRMSDAHRLIAVDMHGWPQAPPGKPADVGRAAGEWRPALGATGGVPAPPEDPDTAGGNWLRWLARWVDFNADDDDPAAMDLGEVMARSLDAMQAQMARMQLAFDPPELVIRIPRDACSFYEFWRTRELMEIGRREADKVLDAAGY